MSCLRICFRISSLMQSAVSREVEDSFVVVHISTLPFAFERGDERKKNKRAKIDLNRIGLTTFMETQQWIRWIKMCLFFLEMDVRLGVWKIIKKLFIIVWHLYKRTTWTGKEENEPKPKIYLFLCFVCFSLQLIVAVCVCVWCSSTLVSRKPSSHTVGGKQSSASKFVLFMSISLDLESGKNYEQQKEVIDLNSYTNFCCFFFLILHYLTNIGCFVQLSGVHKKKKKNKVKQNCVWMFVLWLYR